MNKINSKPIFTISIFGGSGSGKTVYFASLYKELKDYSNYNFKIDSKFENITKLDNYWSTISDINSGWPVGTRKMEDFEFSCYVKVEDKEYETCKFRYVDYSGGIFYDDNHDNIDLIERLQETDIAFILLDSYKIAKFINNTNTIESEVKIWMRELNTIFNLIRTTRKKNIPVHFIVTKWDYLQDFNSKKFNNLENLKDEIKKMYSEINPIKKFIESRNEKNIRLIPVSAVGQDFIKYEQESDGRIITTKLSGGKLKPCNVVVPIAYALIDTVEFTNKIYEEEVQKNWNIVRLIIMLKRYFIALVEAKFESSWRIIIIQVVINTFINKFPETNEKFNNDRKYKEALTTNYKIFKDIIERFEGANGTIFR